MCIERMHTPAEAAIQTAIDELAAGGGINRGVAVIYFIKTANRFTLDGFTVANCYATNSGGGVLLFSDDRAWDGVAQNCVISNNTVDYGAKMDTWTRQDHADVGAYELIYDAVIYKFHCLMGMN